DALAVRPWALLFGLVLMIVGYLMALLGLVFAGCAVVGMAYGTFWSLMAAICAELYGRSHLAATYTLIQIAQVTGSFLLASLLFGRLYDAESFFDGSLCVLRLLLHQLHRQRRLSSGRLPCNAMDDQTHQRFL
ncbi:hypothetical protein FOZ63_015628, partial [Perkinsus olseni]